MSNPLFGMMGGGMPPVNPLMQRLQQFMQTFRGDPRQQMQQMLQQFMQTFRGDPRQQVQQLLNSGRVSQEQYNSAVQTARQMQQMLGIK